MTHLEKPSQRKTIKQRKLEVGRRKAEPKHSAKDQQNARVQQISEGLALQHRLQIKADSFIDGEPADIHWKVKSHIRLIMLGIEKASSQKTRLFLSNHRVQVMASGRAEARGM